MGALAVKEKLATGVREKLNGDRLIVVAHLAADLHKETSAANDETASGRGYISSDPMSVTEHVARWRATLGQPNQPPLEINSYVYAADNPLRWTDPTGMSVASSVCGALGIPPSVCAGAGAAAGGSLGAALGAGAGTALFSPDACPSDKDEEDCVEQWRRAYEICADEMKRGGGRGVTGGHRDEYQCAKGLVSQKCGGNKVQ